MTTTTKKPKWGIHDTIGLSFAILAVMAIFTTFVTFSGAREAVRTERVEAWDAMAMASDTLQEKELMVFLSDRIMRCAKRKALGPSPSEVDLPFTLSPSTYKGHYRNVFVAHEQACLAYMRGETLASAPEGREMIFGVAVPR